MKALDYDPERLEILLLEVAGNEIGKREREELNTILKRSRAARSFAARHMVLDARISDHLAVESTERSYQQESETADKTLRFPLMKIGKIVAVAAVVLFGGWFALWFSGSGGGTVLESPVAFVNNANRVAPFSKGESFDVGDWIRFERGWMALHFEDGAKLAIEGPAELQIRGANAAKMTRGRATIRVPGKIKGFTLETPSERVVDLGTSFGVEVDSVGDTSIAVFEGEIELQGAQHEKGGRKFIAGASVKVSEGPAGLSEIPYNVTDYLATWQASFGVVAIEGDLRVSNPIERSRPGSVVDSEHLLLFPEKESIALPKGFLLSVGEPGEYANRDKTRRLKKVVSLGSEQSVDSYLLQFNPGTSKEESASRRFEGGLRFDRPIVGLLLSNQLLDATDSVLGFSETDFTGVFRRGINSTDTVNLSADRLSLNVSFNTHQGVDQIRVLVSASQQPN